MNKNKKQKNYLKGSLTIVIIFSLMFSGLITVKSEKTDSYRSEYDLIEVEALINPNSIIIDVRNDAEFSKKHIEGAVHITSEEFACGSCIENNLDDYKNRPVYIYSDDGPLSKFIVDTLAVEYGFTEVSILSGSLSELEEIGFTIVEPIDPEIFYHEIDENIRLDKLVFLFFYADWCGYCKKQDPEIERLKEMYKEEDIVFYDINAPENPQVKSDFKVTGYPRMFLIIDKNNDEYVFEEFKGYTSITVLNNLINKKLGIRSVLNNIEMPVDKHIRDNKHFVEMLEDIYFIKTLFISNLPNLEGFNGYLPLGPDDPPIDPDLNGNTGCADPYIDCNDDPCPPDYWCKCEQSTGECCCVSNDDNNGGNGGNNGGPGNVEPCEDDGDCPTDEYCVDGECVDCRTDYHCPGGYCEDGECVECKEDIHCPDGEYCVDGECVECKDDSDCPGGYCVDGECVECKDDSDCPDGYCVDGDCLECKDDSDCEEGQICVDGECEDECEECEDSEDVWICVNEEYTFNSPCPNGVTTWETDYHADPSSGEGEEFTTKWCCPGEYILTVNWESSDGKCSDSKDITVNVIRIDIDVDSNNDGFIDQDNSEDGSDDPIEDNPALPGKYLMVNNDDDDKDLILDYNDFQNSNEDDFIEMLLVVSEPVDLSIATISIETYQDGGSGDSLRIWTKYPYQSRDPRSISEGGDYVANGIYDASQLGLSNSHRLIILHLEGLRACPQIAADHIIVGVDPDGKGDLTEFMCPDSLRVSPIGLELIDAQAFSPNMQGRIDDDPFSEVDDSYLRLGAFADGASVLVIRMKPFDLPFWSEFKIEHTRYNTIEQHPAYIGSLHKYNNFPYNNFPSIPALDWSGEGDMSIFFYDDEQKLVFYRPPNNFFFGSAQGKQEMKLSVKIDGIDVFDRYFYLVRPTVLLAHGVTSSTSAMTHLRDRFTDNSEARVIYFNWNMINTEGYDVVAQAIKPAIEYELNTRRFDHRIAATRVDWVGHSMGGVIAKWYASNMEPFLQGRGRDPFNNPIPPINWPGTKYLRADNFGIGDYRRLITIGSPLRGSEIADVVTGTISYPIIAFLSDFFDHTHGNGCAVYDLTTDGPATLILREQHPIVSWYPIVGLATESYGDDLLWPFDIFASYLSDFTYSQVGFTPQNSDMVVRDYSQVDVDLPDYPGGRKHGEFEYLTHGEEPQSDDVADRIMETLDLYYSNPNEAVIYPGWIYFNAGF